MQKITQKRQEKKKQQLVQAQAQVQAQTQVSVQAKAQPSASSKEQYILEIMKAKNYKAVDRERAILALIGVEANVIKIKEKNNVYFKLTLGPYGQDAALAKQQILAKNKIKTVVNKV